MHEALQEQTVVPHHVSVIGGENHDGVLRLPRGLEAREDLPYPIINHFDHAVGGRKGRRQQGVIAIATGRHPGALIPWMNTCQMAQVRWRLRQIIEARGR